MRAVFAFGSFATGKSGPRSDLDLFVVRVTAIVGIERGTDLAAEADLGIALDLIVVTPEEFGDKLPMTTFGQTILSTARQVCAALSFRDRASLASRGRRGPRLSNANCPMIFGTSTR